VTHLNNKGFAIWQSLYYLSGLLKIRLGYFIKKPFNFLMVLDVLKHDMCYLELRNFYNTGIRAARETYGK